MIKKVSHASDFSAESRVAYSHALALALVHRCRLDLLHVQANGKTSEQSSFPHIRDTLLDWGLLPPHATIESIAEMTGITVRKIDIIDDDAVTGLAHFLVGHRPDLLVMSTHGRKGIERWVSGSVSAEIARNTRIPTLFIGPKATGFVDEQTGALKLQRVLVPVALDPPPHLALSLLTNLLPRNLIELDCLHVGDDAPTLMTADLSTIAVRRMDGDVVETILLEATRKKANLIAMVTAGHTGFLDALRGSTTEQIVKRAHCPVLALPA